MLGGSAETRAAHEIWLAPHGSEDKGNIQRLAMLKTGYQSHLAKTGSATVTNTKINLNPYIYIYREREREISPTLHIIQIKLSYTKSRNLNSSQQALPNVNGICTPEPSQNKLQSQTPETNKTSCGPKRLLNPTEPNQKDVSKRRFLNQWER